MKILSNFIYIQEILSLKKFLAIIILAAFLFATTGYTFLFKYFMNLADEQLVDRADRHYYEEDDLIELKTPLNLPYYTSSAAYERIDGEIELNGIHYNYVKRKISNDTLYLMCLPNESKTKLHGSMLKFTEQAADIPGGTETNKTTQRKLNLLSDYYYTDNLYTFTTLNLNGTKENISESPGLLSLSLPINYPPPRVEPVLFI